MQFQLAYLQIHSHFSPFGGISEIESLAEALEQLNSEANQPVAAALTDTFSVAGFPLWQRLLSGTNLTPLAGAEIGVSFGERSLPFSLLLLVESQAGYANLCRLLSTGLTQAGEAPLTARVDLELLAAHSKGLIAIAPYTGGPVTAALLTQKNQEAKSRAATLRDLFGPGSFYVGAPPLAAQLQPQTIDRGGERGKGFDPVKVNAGLVKLCRDLKISLIGTGETRFARPEEAPQFLAARGRLQKALTGQFSPHRLQHSHANQDWLYSPRSGWPAADLYLRPAAELVAHYNEADWPGALAANLLVAERCAAWQPAASPALSQLRQDCEQNLLKMAGPDESKLAGLRLKLEGELVEVNRLDLAGALLAARQLMAQADPAQIILARRLNNSLVAALLGLTASGAPPEATESDSYPFEAYTNGRPLRLEVGPNGREKLLERLNSQELKAAPLALTTDPGEVPTLHPRLVLYSPAKALADLVVLQPASARQGLVEGVQSGPVAPAGTSRFEISESAGLGHLQLALRILNRWQAATGQACLAVKELPAAVLSDKDPDSLERQAILKQLEWFRLENPAAYFAAALTLAPDEQTRLNGIAQAIRLAGLALLAPDIQTGQVEASLEGQENPAIRVGLGRVLDPATARLVVKNRPPAGFSGLDELIKKVPLTAGKLKKLAWSGALDAFGKREQISAAALTIEQAGQNWREWQQHQQAAEVTPPPPTEEKDQPADLFGGQLSLFDFSLPFEPTAVEPVFQEPEPIKLEEAPAPSALEQLRRSYEVLGFFNAEHPLWNQPTFANADTNQGLPLTIAEALQQTEKDQPVMITGLITALRRIPVKVGSAGDQGEELLVLNVEDFSGQAQLLVSHKAPVGGLELKEGSALAARAQKLPGQAQVLAAVALAPFPPQPGDPVAFPPDEVLDPETGNALEAYPAADPPSSGAVNPDPAQEDNGWANSLFASVGVEEAPKPVPAPAAGNHRGRNGGKAAPPPRPIPRTRRVHIHLPKDVELDIMDRLKQVLRQHAGEDALIIHLPLPDGSIRKLEPQSLQVTYGPALVNDINSLIGTGGIELEER